MEQRHLQIEDYYSIKVPGQGQISPCGQEVIYVLQEVDQEEDTVLTNLYRVHLATGEQRPLTHSGKDHVPRLSPDGKRLAFLSNRNDSTQIYIMDREGGEAWILPTEEEVASLEWCPDGRHIIYTAYVFSQEEDWQPYPGAPDYDGKRLKELALEEQKGNAKKKKDTDKDKEKLEVKVITRFSYRGDGTGYYGPARSQVFKVEVPDLPPAGKEKPPVHQVTKGDYDHLQPVPHPHRPYLALIARRSPDADQRQERDIWLWHHDEEEYHLLFQGAGPVYQPAWSPCGNYIAFFAHDQARGSSTTTHLYILPLQAFFTEFEEKGTAKPLTLEQAQDITRPLDRPVDAYAGPDLRLGKDNPLAWQDDVLYFIMTDSGVPALYRTDVQGKVEKVLGDSSRGITGIEVRGDLKVFTVSSPVEPQEIRGLNHNGEFPVSRANDGFLSGIHLGSWEHMPYEGRDGTSLDGWILYPPEYKQDKSYPLLLLIHGGPHGAYGPTFMFTGQQFARAGYIVFYTNPRGSESYGQEFAACIDGNWGDVDYTDIMDGVDALMDRVSLHTGKLFAHGWSYGGYMACWIPTQTHRFRAICAGASVTNLASGYGTSDITLADEWEYGGKPWRDTLHLMKHSPLGHVENVQTPMLLIHGEHDLRCPIGQTEEFYQGLKRLGREVVMIRYPNEYHGLKRPRHRVDLWNRLLSWFNYYRDLEE